MVDSPPSLSQYITLIASHYIYQENLLTSEMLMCRQNTTNTTHSRVIKLHSMLLNQHPSGFDITCGCTVYLIVLGFPVSSDAYGIT